MKETDVTIHRMISKDMALVATAGREDGTRCGRVLQEKMAWGRTGLGKQSKST